MEILERYEDGVIALIEIHKLRDHEEIKQEYLKKLTAQIKKDNELKFPLIVDKYSNVVLDGHHRFFALKKLGCKRVPAYLVDYYNPNIKVDSWHPLVKTKTEVKSVFKCLGSAGFHIENVENEDVVKVLVEADLASVGMVVRNDHEEYFIARAEGKTHKDAMQCIKKGIETEGIRKELDYVGEEAEVELMLKSKKATMAIFVPNVTKEKVVETGVSGEALPPKTTRHILPEKINYPVSLDVLKEKGRK
jgi:uncharacterized protein (DUF1015 family)